MKAKDLMRKLEKNTLALGVKRLKEKKLSSFSGELLIFEEDTLPEHESMQAGALAYYSVLLVKAKTAKVKAKGRFDTWWNRKYVEVNDLLLEETDYKPTAPMIEGSIKTKYGVAYREHLMEVRDFEKLVALLEAWCSAWKQKSFSMQNIGEFKITKLGVEDREIIKRRVRKSMEE